MIAIKNGRIITPDEVIDSKTLLIENDRIISITGEKVSADKVINAHGRYVMPGFIDVHSDKIEQFIYPRPTAKFPFELALKECEKELLQLGITTIYHSFSLYKDELLGKSPLRNKESVLKMANLIARIAVLLVLAAAGMVLADRKEKIDLSVSLLLFLAAVNVTSFFSLKDNRIVVVMILTVYFLLYAGAKELLRRRAEKKRK